MTQTIIDPVPAEAIQAELTPERFLRRANRGGTDLYIVDAHSCPNAMREIGRLREIAFRSAGGGTGKDCDIDEFDTMENPCQQLIVWDPEEKLILGGYRFIRGKDIQILPNGAPRIATGHMFRFSKEFIDKYLPQTLELGRSFVRTEYQSSKKGAKAIYVLDNLWDGLGALTIIYPEIKYLFGKVTMYPNYVAECRNMILYFLNLYFPDPDRLVYPIKALETGTDLEEMRRIFVGGDFKRDYRKLQDMVRSHGLSIPPLVNAYMSLSPTMKMFGTAINDEFGDVEESGIFFAIEEIFEEKKRRHIASFTVSPLNKLFKKDQALEEKTE